MTDWKDVELEPDCYEQILCYQQDAGGKGHPALCKRDPHTQQRGNRVLLGRDARQRCPGRLHHTAHGLRGGEWPACHHLRNVNTSRLPGGRKAQGHGGLARRRIWRDRHGGLLQRPGQGDRGHTPPEPGGQVRPRLQVQGVPEAERRTTRFHRSGFSLGRHQRPGLLCGQPEGTGRDHRRNYGRWPHRKHHGVDRRNLRRSRGQLPSGSVYSNDRGQIGDGNQV